MANKKSQASISRESAKPGRRGAGTKPATSRPRAASPRTAARTQSKAAPAPATKAATPARTPAAPKPKPRKADAPKAAPQAAPRMRTASARGRAASRLAPASDAPVAAEWTALGEQEKVGAAKYGAPSAARGFDEQRFLFPRNYEVNRVRLVVRDPEWLFAYWDVNPRAFDGIRREMGERVMALSRLTLKVADPDGSGVQVILLPYGVRSWYVRIDPARRSYVAELGITLPSGQFRSLATSNVVGLPRVGPSPQPADRSVNFQEAWATLGEIATGVAEAASSLVGQWLDAGTSIRPGPSEASGARPSSADLAGASDLFRR
jgi:hypothetical protein